MSEFGICKKCFHEDRITEGELEHGAFLCRKCGNISKLSEALKIRENPFALEYDI